METFQGRPANLQARTETRATCCLSAVACMLAVLDSLLPFESRALSQPSLSFARHRAVCAMSVDEADGALRQLMVRYQQGELEAFEALYARTISLVRGYLGALVRDGHRAADLAQEAFLQAHRSRQTYDPAYPFAPWLLGIARHVWHMDQRTWWRRWSREVTGLDSAPELPVPAEMERLADRDALGRALAGLKTDRREAVVLHHVYGLSFREIAAIAGISENAARVRAFRGMADLRRVLRPGASHV
jgi:RNA polymerase sigma-70 factor (ECF subfamily)